MRHVPRLILLITLILASVVAAFYTWRTQDSLEGFLEDEAHAVLADGGAEYAKRMYVMKLFDALLKRRATSSELDEFSRIELDTDILTAVIDRYHPGGDNVSNKSASAASAATPADAAPAATPATATTSPAATAPTSATPLQPAVISPAANKQQLLHLLQDISDRAAESHAMILTL